jgi:cell division septation protein DedD
MIQERRHFERVGLDSHLLVLLAESKYGLLADLCEDGLAADVLSARSLGETIPFSFYLPEKSNCIQGRAEIVWTNELEHRIGLHFLELTDPSRQQLVEWISAKAGALGVIGAETGAIQPSVATGETPAPVNPVVEDSADNYESRPMSLLFSSLPSEEYEPENSVLTSGGEMHNHRRLRHTIAIALASVLLFSVLGFVVYHWRGTRNNLQVTETTAAAAANAPELPAEETTAPVKPSATTTPISVPTPRLDLPGFVLQVGAMRQEANADALAHDLQGKNFPAFVFRRGSDRFYRVAVGPYTDKDTPVKVKRDLEKRGLKAFLKRWVPE